MSEVSSDLVRPRTFILPNSPYVVIYWQGGAESGEWRKCLPVVTVEEASQMAESLRRGGRMAFWARASYWDLFGLPEGAPSREELRGVGFL